MLTRLILFVVLGVFVTWVVRTARKELASLPDDKVRRASKQHASLDRAVVHRAGLASLKGEADVLAEADRILAMMAELVERREILVEIRDGSDSETAGDEVTGIDVTLARSEQRLKEALELLVGEQVADVRTELKAASTDLREEVRARREIRTVERG